MRRGGATSGRVRRGDGGVLPRHALACTAAAGGGQRRARRRGAAAGSVRRRAPRRRRRSSAALAPGRGAGGHRAGGPGTRAVSPQRLWRRRSCPAGRRAVPQGVPSAGVGLRHGLVRGRAAHPAAGHAHVRQRQRRCGRGRRGGAARRAVVAAPRGALGQPAAAAPHAALGSCTQLRVASRPRGPRRPHAAAPGGAARRRAHRRFAARPLPAQRVHAPAGGRRRHAVPPCVPDGPPRPHVSAACAALQSAQQLPARAQ
mmetsp:Transcript_16692/g.49946  ORF Transcript_16692/g.49946 Transcript_16692/m.49946 type:complete len:258 (-) Transcript_16692:1361-2134(-)